VAAARAAGGGYRVRLQSIAPTRSARRSTSATSAAAT
jgi:hypothetical protein